MRLGPADIDNAPVPSTDRAVAPGDMVEGSRGCETLARDRSFTSALERLPVDRQGRRPQSVRRRRLPSKCRTATVAGRPTANTQCEQWTARQDAPPPGVWWHRSRVFGDARYAAGRRSMSAVSGHHAGWTPAAYRARVRRLTASFGIGASRAQVRRSRDSFGWALPSDSLEHRPGRTLPNDVEERHARLSAAGVLVISTPAVCGDQR
jgi:hypothetical protein